jgi:hypothetical protein
VGASSLSVNMLYLWFLYYNSGCMNAPDCYVMRTLPVLLLYQYIRAVYARYIATHACRHPSKTGDTDVPISFRRCPVRHSVGIWPVWVGVTVWRDTVAQRLLLLLSVCLSARTFVCLLRNLLFNCFSGQCVWNCRVRLIHCTLTYLLFWPHNPDSICFFFSWVFTRASCNLSVLDFRGNVPEIFKTVVCTEAIKRLLNQPQTCDTLQYSF